MTILLKFFTNHKKLLKEAETSMNIKELETMTAMVIFEHSRVYHHKLKPTAKGEPLPFQNIHTISRLGERERDYPHLEKVDQINEDISVEVREGAYQ